MPENEVLRGVAEDLKEIEPKIEAARDLVNAMREAGEDVTELQADIRDLEIRKRKWERMLSARGLM